MHVTLEHECIIVQAENEGIKRNVLGNHVCFPW
jgi:hypothetical protein